MATARAIADTALDHRELPPVRALVTAAVQRRACTLVELIDELGACPRRHSRLFRLALHDAVGGARSAAEAAAAARLSRSSVPPFELNVPIVDEHGVLIYVVDVLWRDLRAALEIDSREYHFSESDWLATLDRHNALTRYGLAVTHYPPSRVTRRGDGWTNEVAEWLQARVAELGVTPQRGHGVVAPPVGASPPAFVVRRRLTPQSPL